MKDHWMEKAEAIRLEDFHYHLPHERIARYPLNPRDSSKLLVYKEGQVVHRDFIDLAESLPDQTLLVFNDTKVIPARAHFQKQTGAIIEILLLHPEQPTQVIDDAMLVTQSCVWACMIGNKKRWKSGEPLTTHIQINGENIGLRAEYADYEGNRVRLSWNSDAAFLDVVKALGQIPLPPYLNRGTEEADKETYQTVYASHDGAVAAPTAGLHFTDRILEGLRTKGINKSFLTLHVGAGTFQPIKASSVTEHKMHSEQVVFTRQLVNELLVNIEMVVPVGTTSLRSLESLYWYGVKLHRSETTVFRIEKLYPYAFEDSELPTIRESLTAIAHHMDDKELDHMVGETEIFIFPGYNFRLCKGLITNYHQPGSTLILLVAAFVGGDWRRIYKEAMEKGYRFLSYGDSSLLWGNKSITEK